MPLGNVTEISGHHWELMGDIGIMILFSWVSPGPLSLFFRVLFGACPIFMASCVTFSCCLLKVPLSICYAAKCLTRYGMTMPRSFWFSTLGAKGCWTSSPLTMDTWFKCPSLSKFCASSPFDSSFFYFSLLSSFLSFSLDLFSYFSGHKDVFLFLFLQRLLPFN